MIDNSGREEKGRHHRDEHMRKLVRRKWLSILIHVLRCTYHIIVLLRVCVWFIFINLPPTIGALWYCSRLGHAYYCSHLTQYGSCFPPPPTFNNDEIFVSIVSHSDGINCAATLNDLFKNADHPERVTVGLVEQNSNEEDDELCLEAYCKLFNVRYIKKTRIRKYLYQYQPVEGREQCPHLNQIKLVSVNSWQFHGNEHARAMLRRELGNQEYCMQVSSASQFSRHWDTSSKRQWLLTNNEFAILSSSLLVVVRDGYRFEDASIADRSCHVQLQDTAVRGVPTYDIHVRNYPSTSAAPSLPTMRLNGKHAKSPTVSRFLSSSYIFSKCHLEEAVPADPFIQNIDDESDFARFARAWTRGYDAYVPIEMVASERDHHPLIPLLPKSQCYEWSTGSDYGRKDRRDACEKYHVEAERLHNESAVRIKSFLDIDENHIIMNETVVANLGIYGLGARRSLDQLKTFLTDKQDDEEQRWSECYKEHLRWVPYKHSISPFQHLVKQTPNLLEQEDPQPEFPKRTRTSFGRSVLEN